MRFDGQRCQLERLPCDGPFSHVLLLLLMTSMINSITLVVALSDQGIVCHPKPKVDVMVVGFLRRWAIESLNNVEVGDGELVETAVVKSPSNIQTCSQHCCGTFVFLPNDQDKWCEPDAVEMGHGPTNMH
eukprot:334541-Amphidinium_carterae.1